MGSKEEINQITQSLARSVSERVTARDSGANLSTLAAGTQIRVISAGIRSAVGV